ncbi:MAG: 30S ribosomal protein S20 [Chloroflexota bacterium]|nr:MAG: 30S ribosomal protein S20 [Chloroflexota bacterium]
MANTKSALKAARVSERRRSRNKPIVSAVRTYVGKAAKAVTAKDPSGAPAAVLQAVKALDKAASKGVIHPNNAARRKSRLMKKLNAVQSS